MSGSGQTVFAALAVLCRRLAKRALRKSERWHKRADQCEGRTGPAPAAAEPAAAAPAAAEPKGAKP